MKNKTALACQRCQTRNYWTTKTSNSREERLQIKKYCKKCAAHTMHAETK
ncbi:50S ribosomal protein L33 [Alkalicoccus saliphilus]|uniref:Large ribosomal subunit protein bL33 n=1 Tax=Alkalicoccus saliphilus TaxID=200989 RepID=A0A2T4U502_9BACI|nr:50S ribosomal protein L33 [Alkalicoccus saliphilus]PTL38480.1 50S ribosomal protein L33 [Alkalicoccus saliphilus]